MTRLSLLVSCAAALFACGGNSSSGGNTDAGGSAAGIYTIPLTTPDGPVTFYAPMLTAGGTSFAMDLDTGSTTTALAGSACNDCSGQGFTLSPLYTPSSSAVDQGSAGESEYADGTGWYGEIWKDTVGLGAGTPTATFNIVDISTQMVPNDPNAMTGFFQDNGYQGILGMGPPENEIDDTGAYFDSITKSGVKSIMAFELCPSGGTMWLGGYDTSKASGTVEYTPMDAISTQNAFYAVDLTGVSVGSDLAVASTDLGDWVLDTGTSLFYPTTSVFNAAVANIDSSSGFKTLFGASATLDPNQNQQGCVTPTASGVTDAMIDAMMPTFTIKLKNANGGADISLAAPALSSYLYSAGQNQYCLAMGDGGNFPTMGDEILQAFVTVVDVEHQQIGLALDAGCSASSKVHDRSKRFHPPKPRGPRRRD